jgi:transcriptional regulator with XRE-family HTH domain
MELDLVEGVARCIKRLRSEKNISQEELAEKANLDRTYISGVERAVRNISLNSLNNIIQALDLNVEQFLKLLTDEIHQEKSSKIPGIKKS